MGTITLKEGSYFTKLKPGNLVRLKMRSDGKFELIRIDLDGNLLPLNEPNTLFLFDSFVSNVFYYALVVRLGSDLHVEFIDLVIGESLYRLNEAETSYFGIEIEKISNVK